MADLLLVTALTLLQVILCEQVPPPVNPTVQALNTNYTLLWDWAGLDRQHATFTVHYISKFRLKRNHSDHSKHWKTACEEMSDMLCDLNPLNLHYLGIYTLRIRATVNGHHSDWVQKDFAPAKDAAVGPPTRVLVSPVGNDLEVSISEPQTSNNTSMKEKIPSLSYRFMHWEQHTDHKRSQAHLKESKYTMVVLKDLKSWTWYCVSVQSWTTEPNRTSAFTDPVCISTQGEFHWGKFSWTFGTSLFLVCLILFGIVLGCFHSKKSLETSVAQPVFLDEHWDFPPMLQSSDWQSEQCDHLTVKSSSEEHVRSSARSEWQSGSDSQDSGISAKGTSEQSTQLQNVEQLSVQDTCLTIKNVQLIPDEGFGDIPV